MNGAGRMVEKWYREIENKYPGKRCHEMVVMPNPVHCIIENTDDRTHESDAHVGAPLLRGRPIDITTNDEYCGHNNNNDQPGTGINNEFGDSRGEQSATGEKPEINRPNKYGEPDGQYPENAGQTNGTHGTHIGAHVETHGRASLQKQPSPPPFIRKPKSISSFIGGFKSAINSKIDDYIDEHHLEISKYNRDNHFFQPNYYDHIIRNEQSCQNISKYIINNPAKWG